MLQVLRPLASLRLTFVGLGLLAAGAGIGVLQPQWLRPLVGVAIGVLVVNLLAAIAFTPAFRRQLPLMTFHVALLLLAVLVLASVLTAFKGSSEIAEGQWFDGQMVRHSAGAWHDNHRLRLPIFLDRVDLRLRPDGRVADMQGFLRVEEDGVASRRVLTLNEAVRVNGVQITRAPARGYAALLAWTAAGGGEAPAFGTVHFPPIPVDPHALTASWTLPADGRQMWLKLELPASQPPVADAVVRPPAHAELVIRDDRDLRRVLRRGEEVSLPGGTLRFVELRWWIGLSFHYDPAQPWLLAASLVAVAALGWHFWRKFARVSWAQ